MLGCMDVVRCKPNRTDVEKKSARCCSAAWAWAGVAMNSVALRWRVAPELVAAARLLGPGPAPELLAPAEEEAPAAQPSSRRTGRAPGVAGAQQLRAREALQPDTLGPI